jgi:hypothetical protein
VVRAPPHLRLLAPSASTYRSSCHTLLDALTPTRAFCVCSNPPFDVESVGATFEHIDAVLRRAEQKARHQRNAKGGGEVAKPLLFVVVTPFVPKGPKGMHSSA